MLVLNDVLEGMLYQVDMKIQKEVYRDIDNTPKHLLHMTDADLMPKSPA